MYPSVISKKIDVNRVEAIIELLRYLTERNDSFQVCRIITNLIAIPEYS